jgi:hypothetical protein
LKIQTLKLQHNRECKGLMAQIHYVKAKFTRESNMRYDLAYQKRYILAFLSRTLEYVSLILVESTDSFSSGSPALAAISMPQRRRPKLKSVVKSLIFLQRIRLYNIPFPISTEILMLLWADMQAMYGNENAL